jgi:hypothetical protein
MYITIYKYIYIRLFHEKIYIRLRERLSLVEPCHRYRYMTGPCLLSLLCLCVCVGDVWWFVGSQVPGREPGQRHYGRRDGQAEEGTIVYIFIIYIYIYGMRGRCVKQTSEQISVNSPAPSPPVPFSPLPVCVLSCVCLVCVLSYVCTQSVLSLSLSVMAGGAGSWGGGRPQGHAHPHADSQGP